MQHPKDVGDRSTLAIVLALREAGFALLLPFGENTRYDLAIDDGARIARVQCKTGRLRRGAVVFSVCSTYAHHPRPRAVGREYQGEVDYFAIFFPELVRCYLIPISDLPVRREGKLRVDPPRNNQWARVRFARDYEIGGAGTTPGPRGPSGER